MFNPNNYENVGVFSNQIHLYISSGIVNSPESSETKSISDVTYFGRVNQYIKTNEQSKQQAKSAVSIYDGSVTDSVTLRRPSGFYTIFLTTWRESRFPY